MKKDFLIFIEHIFDSIEKIEKYVKNLTEEDFAKNDQCQDAIIKRFEIIGEATKKLPLDFRKKHPEINWKKLADTRNFFIHEYFGINRRRLWRAIIQDIPDLKNKISKILKNSEQQTLPHKGRG